MAALGCGGERGGERGGREGSGRGGVDEGRERASGVAEQVEGEPEASRGSLSPSSTARWFGGDARARALSRLNRGRGERPGR